MTDAKGEPETSGSRWRILLRRYLPELIYGANDGIITTFAIVSGVVGARLSSRTVLILGVASLFADGFSMGASDYLSERSRLQEKEPLPPRKHSLKRAAMTFVSFVTIGSVPLLAYLLPVPDGARFWTAGALTLATLFAVGAARSLVSRLRWLRSGIEMFIVGALAAGVAYGIGAVISNLTSGSATAL